MRFVVTAVLCVASSVGAAVFPAVETRSEFAGGSVVGLVRALQSAEASEVREAKVWLEGEGEASEEARGVAWQLLFTRWVELAPEEAYAAAGGHEVTCLTAWFRRDPGAASAAVTDLPEPLKIAAVQELTTLDAKQSLRLALAGDPPSLREKLVAAWADELARHDAELLGTLYRELRDPSARAEVGIHALRALGKRTTSPAVFTEMVLAAPPGAVRSDLARDGFARWGGENPEAATAWIIGNTTGCERDVYLAAALSRAPDYATHLARTAAVLGGRFDPEARIDHIEPSLGSPVWRNGIDAGTFELGNLFKFTVGKLGERGDTPAALELLSHMPFGQRRTNYTKKVIEDWAESDPAGATLWVARMPGLEDRAVLGVSDLEIFGKNWAARDPAAAWEALAGLPPGAPKNSALGGALIHCLDAAPGVVSRWVKSAAEEETREVLRVSVGGLANTVDAQFRVLSVIGQDKMGHQTATTLATSAGEQNPEKYKDWVRDLPETKYEEQARNRFASAWAAADPAAASAWLATLPKGKGRTDSITGFLWGTARSKFPDEEGIRAWLDEIEPAAERLRLEESVRKLLDR